MKVLVFDVGGTEIKYSLMDENLNDYDSGYVDTPLDSFESFSDLIYKIYEPHKDEADGIAMSLPGFIDTKNGRCNGGGNLKYNHGTDVGPLLSKKCGCKVVLENDGKAAAKAEHSRGVLQGCSNAAVFIIGTGVGGGLIIDGKIVKGRHFTAGEYSYINTNQNDFFADNSFVAGSCSTRSLLMAYQSKTNSSQILTGRQFFEILGNDEIAKEVFNDFCRNIAIQIYNLYWLLDLEKIAIGGGISRQEILIETINKEFNKLLDETPLSQFMPKMELEILRAKFANEANQIGALMTYLEN